MEYTQGTSAMNVGPCGAFVGKIYFLFVFVSTKEHPWNKTSVNEFYKHYYKLVDNVNYWAKYYGANVSLDTGYFIYDSPYDHHPDMKWMDYILTHHFHQETPNLGELYKYYAERYHVDACPFIFVFNRKGRSYATTADLIKYRNFKHEKAVVFNYKKKMDNVILHEVLHLFGAIDFYYPDYLTEEINKFYPNSIMLTTANSEIDPFTAFLIGWKKTPDYISKYLLDLTEEKGDLEPPKIDESDY